MPRARGWSTLAATAMAAIAAVVPAATLAAEGAPETENVAGAIAGVESTPVAGLYYTRRGAGLVQPDARTTLGFTSALLTRFGGGRLRLERDEVVLGSSRRALRVLLGTGYSFASDAGGRYHAWHAVVGARLTLETGRWEWGARLAYLPVLVAHVRVSDSQRATFTDRYREARADAGPAAVTVWIPGQRVEVLLTARAAFGAWGVDGAGGVELSPAAGREWANLELGQVPVVLRFGVGRTF